MKEEEQDQALTTLMRLCMAVVMQDISKVTVYQSLLMHFLAVIGVDIQTKALRLLFYYMPMLAGVLYINRFRVKVEGLGLLIYPAPVFLAFNYSYILF